MTDKSESSHLRPFLSTPECDCYQSPCGIFSHEVPWNGQTIRFVLFLASLSPLSLPFLSRPCVCVCAIVRAWMICSQCFYLAYFQSAVHLNVSLYFLITREKIFIGESKLAHITYTFSSASPLPSRQCRAQQNAQHIDTQAACQNSIRPASIYSSFVREFNQHRLEWVWKRCFYSPMKCVGRIGFAAKWDNLN